MPFFKDVSKPTPEEIVRFACLFALLTYLGAAAFLAYIIIKIIAYL